MRRVRALVVVALVVLGLTGTAPARAATPNYVALGDSFTAGPLIPLQEEPYGCLRSTNDYPKLLHRDLPDLELRDVSCSGADTSDMTNAQGVEPGPNPPQFDALDESTELVTVGIGGNDIGFSSIAEDCFSPTPLGTPC
jgi:lysophospholipase L1-like esterase